MRGRKMGRIVVGMLAAVTGCLSLNAQPLFQTVPPAQSGVVFNNRLPETPQLNIITYEYFYNGGGVGVADFNRDGLMDIYLSSNLQPNKLYLNRGNFQFEDVTKAAGVAGRPGWKTGVSIADVNADGWPDIYQCYSGDFEPTVRRNQLFINNGNGSFSEQAAAYGIADEGYTTQAAFFDYDRDGDLDLYVLNHNIKNLRNFDAAFVKKMVDPDAGDRLYRNDNGKFTDVSRLAGIISNPLGYGLGLAISDVNADGWPDIYVSNDYVEEDYLYINNRDGSFSERLKQQMGHISNFSMGSDIADINNDGWPDVYTLDMLPADNKRQKLLYAPDNYETYNSTLRNGFHHQLMRNMLHLNNGNNTFSEVGQLSGVAATDWSWSALLADFTNDGRKDLLVTNGYGRDMINRDFMKFYADERLKHLKGETDSRMFRMLQGIKTTPLTNYFFENTDGLHFADRSAQWGFDKAGLSHGAAYADFDNDGDLDIVINNMNDTATVLRNQCVEQAGGKRFLQVKLSMPGKNASAIGSQVWVYSRGQLQMQELYPVRGFQSSMLGALHFGLGTSATIDSVLVRWPDGQWQQAKANLQQPVLSIGYAPNRQAPAAVRSKPVFRSAGMGVDFRHQEPANNDFKIQPLMPSMISYRGPAMASADINGDGQPELFIGGAANQPAALLTMVQGRWAATQQPALQADAAFEDVDARFFDADGDGDADLLAGSGGFSFPAGDSLYAPRLYKNVNGRLVRDAGALPALSVSVGSLLVTDLNNDGAPDILLGARVHPWHYPLADSSVVLLNNGKGQFSVQQRWMAGLVCHLQVANLDADGQNEILVAAEWSSLRVFQYRQGRMLDVSDRYFDQRLTGWWNKVLPTDMDGDGDMDVLSLNWGMNSQLQPNDSLPIELYYADFDDNGSVDPLLCYPIQGKNYPMASRDEMTDQIVSLRQRFPTYDAYSEAQITDVLSAAQQQKATRLTATTLQSGWWRNDKGRFSWVPLPAEAQVAPMYAAAVADFNGDGVTDVLLGGNVEHARIKLGKIDASFGTLLLGQGKGVFVAATPMAAGLSVSGCVRQFELMNVKGKRLLVAAINNGLPQVYEY